jgi:hydrogenase expression/formation protein HypE
MLNLEGTIVMAHGAGGRASHQLIHDLFHRHLANSVLDQGDDGGLIAVGASAPATGEWVMTTDAHVVSPLFFPGGNIGSLAVHGTLNDLAMMGATPVALTVAFILEEGLPLQHLDTIVAAMAAACRKANVTIVAGDTKVVERGKGDGIFITTTGLGRRLPGVHCSGSKAKPGDVVIISGTLGDHAVTLMAERHGLSFSKPLQSDSCSLYPLIERLLIENPSAIHVLRDPTRGGVGTTLNEIAHQSGAAIEIEEARLPIRAEVGATADLLGLDPLYLANEGKAIIICAPEFEDQALTLLRTHPLGENSARIGTVIPSQRPYVEMKTTLGGRRLVDWLSGELLPRIC